MSSTALSYATWHTDATREAAMEESHRPLWRHFIETIPETDLSTRDILDFGCNRGGFLRLLHALKPFRRALGVDIASASVAAAREFAGTAPIEYEVASEVSGWPDLFDLAFSYEVIFLLPNLASHAASIHAALRSFGVYYAVTGCHTGSPLWSTWRDRIGESTNAPVQDRSPEDYAEAFTAAGFEVSVRRFGYAGFVSVSKDRSAFPRLIDAVDYPANHTLLFRLVKES